MAVLTTMDGGDGEQIRYGRVEAYRALDHLRDKVRICHQAGRVSRRDGTKYPSLAMLDRVLVPVRVPGRGSFHPKVWLVRQVNEAMQERFVLVVSSRNITTSPDWDLGIAIEGIRSGRGQSLPRVKAFVEHTLALANDEKRIDSFGDLAEVRWNPPPHVQQFTFDFQAGDDSPRQLHSEWSSFKAKPSRLLLLSPFIDNPMIDEAAKRWGNVQKRRLVAGSDNLVAVALGAHREKLRTLEPRQMLAASESADPPETDAGETNENEIEQSRALHAKVIAFDDGHRATVVLGSNNLTSAGWCGGSTEAFVKLIGAPELCDPLWDWASTHAQHFNFPDPGQAPPKQSILERLKDELHRSQFRLEDGKFETPSRLSIIEPQVLDLPDGVRMEVSRYSTPGASTLFPGDCDAPGSSSAALFSCH